MFTGENTGWKLAFGSAELTRRAAKGSGEEAAGVEVIDEGMRAGLIDAAEVTIGEAWLASEGE